MFALSCRPSFVPSTPLHRQSTVVTLSRRHTCLPNLPIRPLITTKPSAPCMLLSTTTSIELITLSLSLVGAYYILNRPQDDDNKTQSSPSDIMSTTSSSSATSTAMFSYAPSFVPDNAAPVFPSSSSPRKINVIPQPWEIDSVGVSPTLDDDLTDDDDLSTSEDSASVVASREVDWAVLSLYDLEDIDGVAIVDDSTRSIIASQGSLVTTTTDKPATPLPRIDSMNVKNVSTTDGDSVPWFAAAGVQSFAYSPLKDSGATIVLLSRMNDFLGPKEKRVINAVCDKLSNVLSEDDEASE